MSWTPVLDVVRLRPSRHPNCAIVRRASAMQLQSGWGHLFGLFGAWPWHVIDGHALPLCPAGCALSYDMVSRSSSGVPAG